VNLRISQIVDVPNVTVSAFLPTDISSPESPKPFHKHLGTETMKHLRATAICSALFLGFPSCGSGISDQIGLLEDQTGILAQGGLPKVHVPSLRSPR